MKTKLTVMLFTSLLLMTAAQTTNGQATWRTAGNNVTDGQHLGSNNNRSLIITTNGTEKMRIDSTGDITMGSNIGPLHFLFFGTSFHMKFPQDQYIFRHSNSQEGLYRNQTLQRIEYRDPVSVPNMWVQSASTGNDGDDNLRLVANDGTNDWSMFSTNGAAGDLQLFKNGSFRGSFNGTSGIYTASDRRWKKDINALPAVMESVMKLQPKKYHYNESPGTAKYSYGFIAQDVNELFPEFVGAYKDRKTGEEMLTLNYDNFGVIAIKAIQEQQKQIEEQKKAIDELKEMVKNLGGVQTAGTADASIAKTTNAIVTDAVLEQNKPNPLTNNTSIRYNIPGGAKNAQLIITDLSGKTIKQIALNNAGGGTVNLNASTLGSGTYTYALYADGKLIGSKKMIVNR